MSVSLTEMQRQLTDEISRLQELVKSIDKARGERPGTASSNGSVVTARLEGLPAVGTVLGVDPCTGKKLVVQYARTQTPEVRRRIGDATKRRNDLRRARERELASGQSDQSGTPTEKS
jgi:hypothetical protein